MEDIKEKRQLSLFNKTDSNQTEQSVRDMFGCCSRYQACSDAKACLIPQLEYAKDCIYRQSLESGHIFYGKNAEHFKQEVYQRFVNQLQESSECEKEVLTFILYYFFIRKIGIQRLALSKVPELSGLEAAGLIQRGFFQDIVVHASTISPILDACGDRIYEANAWAKQTCDPEK